jgi:3-dehydroquinate dehydratase-1
MLKIGGVTLGELPRVVLGVDGESPSAAQAASEGVDILEVRVDLFAGQLTPSQIVDAVKALKRHEMPLIGTIRQQGEGGKSRLSDAQRADIYHKISPLVDAIDIDVRAAMLKPVVASARRNRNTVILSHHDFRGTPSTTELARMVGKAAALGADITKIATLAKSERDVVRLLEFTMRHRRQHLVTIAMGHIGSVSRLFFPLVGSLLTYTSVSPSNGQVPAERLIEDLRLYYPRYHEALMNRARVVEFA